MSLPALAASTDASGMSAATCWAARSEWQLSQSVTLKPSKPASPRRIAFMLFSSAVKGVPSMEPYAVMTVAHPARNAFSNGGRNVSRRRRYVISVSQASRAPTASP